MTGFDFLSLIAAAAAAYVIGSIPFGLLLTRLAGLGDIRSVGSGNIGATNVLRTGSKPLAALTLAGDVLKGTAGVFVGGWLAGSVGGALIGGLCAFLGHLFPPWLGFRGGKGVATYIGVLAGWQPVAAGLFCLLWLLTAYVTRYSSLSALVASLAAPVVLFFTMPLGIGVASVVMTALLYLRHRSNIKRLVAGDEPLIGAGRQRRGGRGGGGTSGGESGGALWWPFGDRSRHSDDGGGYDGGASSGGGGMSGGDGGMSGGDGGGF